MGCVSLGASLLLNDGEDDYNVLFPTGCQVVSSTMGAIGYRFSEDLKVSIQFEYKQRAGLVRRQSGDQLSVFGFAVVRFALAGPRRHMA
jgi:hypothetical protein